MNVKRKIILFIATSLDGYIAMENGDINWLNTVKGEGDNGFTEFYKTIDTIVMGKTHLRPCVNVGRRISALR